MSIAISKLIYLYYEETKKTKQNIASHLVGCLRLHEPESRSTASSAHTRANNTVTTTHMSSPG